MRNADGRGAVAGQADADVGAAVAADAGARCGRPGDAAVAGLPWLVGGNVARLNGEFGDLFHNGCACAPGANGEGGGTRAPAPKDGAAPGLVGAAGRWPVKEAAGVVPADVEGFAPAWAGSPAADASTDVF
ncbi:MAG: hypothetical protein LBQ10_09915 [Desulfovibrio sp.]|nr:hypothetical protein [Desulfovibrio sp.]